MLDPRGGADGVGGGAGGNLDLPDLPPVPCDTPLGGNTPQVDVLLLLSFYPITTSFMFQDAADDEDIDFDDLTKRFEALKKKK